MEERKGTKRSTRRRFLGRMLQGLGGLGISAGLAGCDPSSYWDYLTLDDADKVDERFNESVSGHAKPLVFPEPESDEFTFLWLSDIHITKGQPDYMDRLGYYAEQVGAVFILHSGDCVDQGLDEEYHKWNRLLDGYLPVPLFTAISNHDVYNDGWDRYKRYIGPCAFKFEYGPCQFIFIDTANGTTGQDQMKWIEKVCKRGRHIPHRFMLSHYPIYDGGLQTPATMGNTEERMKLVSLMDEYHIKYFLCGHKHCGEHYKIRGIRHIISGAGSAYKYILDDDYHFYRFDVVGGEVYKEKIYFDDVEILG